MSDRNSGLDTRVVYTLVAAILLAIAAYGIWGLAVLDTKESISASQRASQYRYDTEQQILKACTVSELSAMRECVAEEVLASEENQRATYDLYAQNAVARWTFWMLVLGLAGTALTGIGLYYLAANLEEMQRQRKVSSDQLELMINEQRPMVSIELEIDKGIVVDGSGARIHYNIIINNFGNAIARDISKVIQFELHPSTFENNGVVYSFIKELGLGEGSPTRQFGLGGEVVFPNEKRSVLTRTELQIINDLPHLPRILLIYGIVKYGLKEGLDEYYTGFAYQILSTSNDLPFQFTGVSVPADKIRLFPMPIAISAK